MTAGPREFTFSIIAAAPFLTENQQRRVHWGQRAKIVKAWRDAAKQAAEGADVKFRRAVVEVEFWQAKGTLSDAGGLLPIAKAVEDGLVDAGVLEGDDPGHVPTLVLHAPKKGAVNAVAVVVREVGEFRAA